MSEHKNNDISCEFCRKPRSINVRLIGSRGKYICSDCIRVADKLLEELEKEELLRENKFLPTPSKIKKELDEYVIGQDEAKKNLSVAVYNHYKRIEKGGAFEGVELQKSNILLIGPTGTGKTLLAQTLAKMLHVPFAIADATTLTEAGYVGDDVENILLRLLQNANYDVKKCEKGIIYLDELDKISRKSENTSITRDVSGEGVQQALLKIIEGTLANVPPQGGRKHPHQGNIQIDTTNILFICGGAFEGIEKIVSERTAQKQLGFIKSQQLKKSNISAAVQPEDLIRYGIIPELVGRLPVVAILERLTSDDLIRVLTQPKNSITKQFQKMFAMEGVELIFTDDALAVIAKNATEHGSGARGLRSIMEKLLLNTMFELPENAQKGGFLKCIIDKNVVTGTQSPILTQIKKKTA